MNIAFASLASLGIMALTVTQVMRMNKHQIDQGKLGNEKAVQETRDMSSFALAKSLLSNSSAKHSYEPAIYPVNYFQNQWSLKLNKDVASSAKNVEFRSFQLRMPLQPDSPKAYDDLFTKAAADSSSDTQELKIIALNRDPVFKYLVTSVDVETKSVAQNHKAPSIGRIPLSSPLPKGLKVLVKPPGAAAFSEDLGKIKPFSPGKFEIKVLGSGVIHYADILIDGNLHRVGAVGKTMTITHRANNVKAVDEEIGTTSIDLNPESSARSRLQYTKCKLELIPRTKTSAEVSPIDLLVKVYGVDGKENEELRFAKEMFVTVKKVEKDTDDRGVIACRDQCEGDWDQYIGSGPLERAEFLDKTKAEFYEKDAKDFYEDTHTNTLHKAGKSGVVCSNIDFVAKAMVSPVYKSASEWAKAKPGDFEANLDKNYIYKRFYAYTAPDCKRTYVATRTSCGCFDENTLIRMGDGSELRVSDIRMGDYVWNPRTQRAHEVAKVTAGPEKYPMYRLRFAGKEVLVTRGHPFSVNGVIKPAKALQVGDKIEGDSGLVALESSTLVEPDPKALPVVWNISLEGSEDPEEHFLMANGVETADLYIQERLQD